MKRCLCGTYHADWREACWFCGGSVFEVIGLQPPTPAHDFSDKYLSGVCCRCGADGALDHSPTSKCEPVAREEIIRKREGMIGKATLMRDMARDDTKKPALVLSRWSVGNPSPVGGGCLWHLVGGPTVGKAQP